MYVKHIVPALHRGDPVELGEENDHLLGHVQCGDASLSLAMPRQIFG
jgi:hypothetical protein